MKEHDWKDEGESPFNRGNSHYKCRGCGTAVECETGTVKEVARRGRFLREDCDEMVVSIIERM